MGTKDASVAEKVAQRFHEAYERLAPVYGYRTREQSAKPWAEVPQKNRDLMIRTVGELMASCVIQPQPEADWMPLYDRLER